MEHARPSSARPPPPFLFVLPTPPPTNHVFVMVGDPRASPPHFYVVLANNSSNDIRLWKEDCSWGYGALSFKMMDSNGNEWVVGKKPRAWRSNYPRWWLLKPNETLIIDVRFAESSVWG